MEDLSVCLCLHCLSISVYLCLSLPFSVYLYLSIYLSIYLSLLYLHGAAKPVNTSSDHEARPTDPRRPAPGLDPVPLHSLYQFHRRLRDVVGVLPEAELGRGRKSYVGVQCESKLRC